MINTPPTNLLHAEIHRLRAQYPSHFLYALLDPHRPLDAEHPLHLDSLRQQEPKLEIQTVLRPDLAYLPALCPHLLTLAKPNEPSLVPETLLDLLATQAIEEVGGDPYVCGVLVSSVPAPATAQHLAEAVVVRQNADAPAQVFALFEPLRLDALARTVAQDWLDTWLGPIVAWRYLDAAGKLQGLNRQSAGRLVSTPLFVLPPAAYSAQQRIPQLADLLQAWREDEQLPQDAARAADAQLEEAARHGLTAIDDVMFFAINGLALPAQWASHPATRTAIQRTVKAECSLADAFDKLDAQSRAEITRA